MAKQKLYVSYQKVGSKDWHVIHADTDFDPIKPEFITVLQIDTPLDKSSSKELIDKAKYAGPLYFDLDDGDDVENSIADAKALVKDLQEAGVDPRELEIALSGKKGLHILVPMECFCEGEKLFPRLPYIYKAVALKFAKDTLDWNVYSGRSGRMLRTYYNVRDNGNYKVAITADELETLTVESYNGYCKAPRTVKRAKPTFAAALAVEFERACKEEALKKPKKVVPLTDEAKAVCLPIAEAIMRGEGVSDTGFNKVAIQLATYAHEAGVSVDQLVERSQGLLANHKSDGSRYNSKRKRERELRRMYAYVEDNSAYSFSLQGLRSLVPNLQSVNSETGETELLKILPKTGLTAGVFEQGDCYAANKGEGLPIGITNCVFKKITQLVDLQGERVQSVVADMYHDKGEAPKRVAIGIHAMSNASTFHAAILEEGGSFQGNDAQAKGLQQIMLNRSGKARKYLIETEGVTVARLPARHGIKEPVILWADGSGVIAPTLESKDPSEFGNPIGFDFQGHPESDGVVKTDLNTATDIGAWLQEEPGNREKLAKVFKCFFSSLTPEVSGRSLGWMAACHYRQLYHACYNQFPLLHVYGAAGSGKSSLIKTLLKMFYWVKLPAEVTPSSTHFAFATLVSGSASIPILMDEYKPATMDRATLEKYRGTFRDAYNMKSWNRGGGNRSKDNFGALNRTTLSGPIVFVGETMETETAIVERYVLVAAKRSSAVLAARNLARWMYVDENGETLAVVGKAIAANIVRTVSLQAFKEKAGKVFEWARNTHMLQEGDDERLVNGELSQAEYDRKKANNTRNVFNNSAVLFGLVELKTLLKKALGDLYDEELNNYFKAAQAGIFSNLEAIARTTVPEYIKVLTTLSDMSRLEPTNPNALVDNMEFNLTDVGGKMLLVMATRAAYNKYRSYCRYLGQSPLYPTEGAFAEGMYETPQFKRQGTGTRNLKVDTVILDMDELARAQVPPFSGRPQSLPI